MRRTGLEIADQAWRLARADEAEALVLSERSGLARFAASRVHQPTLIENETVLLRVVRDGHVGSASTNRTDADGLATAARRAEEAADAAPRDTGFAGLAPPAPAGLVNAFDEATASLSAEERARLAWVAIEAAGPLRLFGYFTSGESEMAVASSTGQAISQQMTDASIIALAASEQLSGWAEASTWRVDAIDPAGVAQEAVEKARRTRGACEADPEVYRAVLEPYAFSEILANFNWSSLNGLAVLEGRSYLAGRVGERIFHPDFTLVDDGSDPLGLPKAFDFEGTPKQPVTIVENGVVRDVVWDRRSAVQAGDGRLSTGHALPAPAQRYGPLAVNLRVDAGDAATADLVERVGDGIYVTRLHYLGVVDEREGIITGMTRDGTFRIREGRIAEPLVNLRFTTSFPELVRNLIGLTRERKLVNTADLYEGRYPTASLVPGVATTAFTVVGAGSGPGL